MERPKNITDTQWQEAVNLYNVAKSKGDRFPELTVAQAALETGWFKSKAGQYNYFGQKATKNQKGVDLKTKEVANNKEYSTTQRFREYDTLDEAVEDRIKKWGSKYKDAKNVDEAISKIWQYDPKTGQGKGYATDTNYGNKIKSILKSLGTDATLEPNQTSSTQSQPYVPLDLNLPEMTGMTFAEEEKETEEKSQVNKREENANKLSFISDVKELQKQQQEQAYQPPQFLEQQLVEGVAYQPIQQNFQEGGIKIDPQGYWNPENLNKPVVIPSSSISMKNVDFAVLGTSVETGEQKLMQPNKNYFFKNTQNVLEQPAKNIYK